MKYQNGFTLLESLIALLIVILLGFGGYYIWSQNNKPVSTANNSLTENSNTHSTQALSIPQWGIKIAHVPSGLGKVSYQMSTSGNGLSFSSVLQQTLPVSCNLS